MLKQFKEFLTQSNALALAVGVIIGAATSKLVTGVVTDLLMPVISLVLPAGDWREAQLVMKRATDATGKETITAIKFGDLAGMALDFFIIACIVFLITKAILPKKIEPATKECPECLELIPAAARKCKHCGSAMAV